LTRLQQWLLLHLVAQTPFDLRDFMICEIEDVILKGFRGKRHMPYCHWLTFLIYMGVNPIEQPTSDEWRGTTTEFPRYDPTQLVRSVTRGTPAR
jgi:hypothetical protein